MPAMARLSVADALAGLAAIEAIAAIFVVTAPEAAARMGSAEGIVARAEMTGIGPMPRFTVDEWSAMAREHAAILRGAEANRTGSSDTQPPCDTPIIDI